MEARKEFISSCLILCLVFLGQTLCLSEEPNVNVYFNDGTDENPSLVQSLKEDLSVILNSPLFKNRLPLRWGILIDQHWDKSEGYFSPDLVTQEGHPAILLEKNAILNPQNRKRLLVHEMAHLLHHQFRPAEENWVKEGLSLLLEYVVNGAFNRSILNAFSNPETSLTQDLDMDLATEAKLSQYGELTLYFYYMWRLCGKNDLLHELLTSSSELKGIEFIDYILKTFSGNEAVRTDAVCSSFEKSFVSFQIAKFFPNPAPPSRYILIGNFSARILDAPVTLKPFSAQAFRISEQHPTCVDGTTQFRKDTCFQVKLHRNLFSF